MLLVNGEPVMRSALARMLKPHTGRELSREQAQQLQIQAMRQLISEKLIDQFLRERKFRPTRAQVDGEISRQKKVYEASPVAARVSFEEMLRRRGISLKALREDPPLQLRFSTYVRANLTEEEVRGAYENDRESWTEVRARHILIDTRKLKTDEEKGAARARAEKLRSEVVAGADFAKLALENSACGSKEQGGDLGYFPRRGRMAEEFAAAAFALEVGEISPVVESPFGYHVIQSMDVRPDPDATLEEARDAVADHVANRRVREIVKKLGEDATITRPGTAPAGGPSSEAPPKK